MPSFRLPGAMEIGPDPHDDPEDDPDPTGPGPPEAPYGPAIRLRVRWL